MKTTIKTWPANVDVTVHLEDEKNTSIMYQIFDVTGDNYSCECDVNTFNENLDTDSLQQWWHDDEGECDRSILTTEQSDYIRTALLDGVKSKTKYMNLTETCENCAA